MWNKNPQKIYQQLDEQGKESEMTRKTKKNNNDK